MDVKNLLSWEPRHEKEARINVVSNRGKGKIFYKKRIIQKIVYFI